MCHKITHRRENEKGIALITTLLFLVVMGLLATTLVFTVLNEIRSSSAYKYNQQAFYVANAGIQKAVQWYRNSYTPHLSAADYDTTEYPVEFSDNEVLLAGQTGYDTNYPAPQPTSFQEAVGYKSLQANTDNTGVYSINATLLKYKPVTFIDLATFTPYTSAMERWKINSIGYWGNVNNPMGISRIEAIIENDGNALFDRGLWGIDGLVAGGDVIVDSFDPNKGVWHATDNNGNKGSLGSNGTIESNGGIIVQGNVGYGPAGSFIVNGGSGIISGLEYQIPEPRYFPSLPPFTAGSGTINLNNATVELFDTDGPQGSYRIGANATLELNEGTYYFSDLDTAAGGQILLKGAVVMFVENGLSLSGSGFISPPGFDPYDVRINYSGTATVNLTGSTSAFMQVYAPNAEVKMNGGPEYHGSFIGKTLTVGGGVHVHFNEDGENKDLIQRPFRILSWSQK